MAQFVHVCGRHPNDFFVNIFSLNSVVYGIFRFCETFISNVTNNNNSKEFVIDIMRTTNGWYVTAITFHAFTYYNIFYTQSYIIIITNQTAVNQRVL